MLGKIAILLLFTFLSLFTAECAARLELLPLPEFVHTDAWWEERWHRKRRGLNPRVFVQLDRDLGYIPAANLRDVEYEGVRISTNASNMRGTREYPLERNGSRRIAVVGDSYVFGQCAADDEAFPAVMEEVLPDTEVLNLGVMGYGQGQAMLRMRRDGFAHDPDVVVFGFHMTDMRRNVIGFRDYGKPRFRLDESGELVMENVPVPQPEEFESWFRVPRLWNFWLIHRDSKVVGTKEHRRHINLTSIAILDRMAQDAHERGLPFVMVHLPHPGALKGDGYMGWPFLRKICAEREVPGRFICASPVPRFREIAPTEQAVRKHFDCHFSAELYRAVGLEVAEVIQRELPELYPPE